jgi:hypothetical protein
MARRFVVVVVVVGCLLVGGVALGAVVAPRGRALKEPAAGAQIASVKGLRFEYGPFVTATAGGPGFLVYAIVHCPRALHALGGGWDSPDRTSDLVDITSNEAGRGELTWIVAAIDQSPCGSPGFSFRATAVCG